MNVLREETSPGVKGLVRVHFARSAVAIKKRAETLFRMNRGPVIHVVKDRVQLRHPSCALRCPLPVTTTMPDAGDNDSMKANILDLVTLLATPLASISPPSVSVMQAGYLGPAEPRRIGQLTRAEVARSRPVSQAARPESARARNDLQ